MHFYGGSIYPIGARPVGIGFALLQFTAQKILFTAKYGRL